MKRIYNEICSKNADKPYWEDRIDDIVKFVGSGKKVLDIGCGYGLISSILKNKGNFVIALDISRKMVLEARRRGLIAYQCDIENEDIPIRYKFDVILMTEVLEHLLDPIPVLRRIKRNLKKEGLLYISTPNCAYWYNRFQLLLGRIPNFGEKKIRPYNINHKTFFDIDTLKKTVEYAGLKILKIKFYLGFSPKRGKPIKIIANNLMKIRPSLFASNIILICKK